MNDSGFKTLENLLHATSLRHRVLTSNIANSDTPGYKARDIDFSKIFEPEMIAMSVTNSQHISTNPVSIDMSTLIQDDPTLSWGDKNNVEVDMETAKMTENALLYQAGVKLMSKKISMYKDALKRR